MLSARQPGVRRTNSPGLGTSAKGAGDGLKGVGDSAKASEAFLAEYNATMAETAAMQDRFAASSAATAASVARSQRLQTTVARDSSAEAVAAQKAQAKASADAAAAAEASSRKHSTALLGIAAAAGYGIYKAGQLQAGVTRLYTTAGESKSNLPMITSAIPKLSGQTATSQADLLQGLYMIESAGYHGKSGLSVLRAAAQGAYAEGAPLGETGNALTSLMNAYKMRPGQATSAMNQIIAMVSSGKMTMSGAVSALPALLPTAASAGLSFSQAGGALASMTALGMSPDQAAQNVRHTITSLAKPSNVQSAELQMLGINPIQLSKDLGKHGLTGTISEVGAAIKQHVGKDGLVMVDVMNQAKLATKSANEEISAMPKSIQGVAKAYLSGSISAKQWTKEIRSADVSARDANLLKQFGSTAGTALGFSQMVKSGASNQQTVTAALNAAMGGQVGQQVAQILGPNMGKFKARTQDIQQAADAGKNVAGWDQIKKTFNFQLKSFQMSAEAALTTVGTALLPAATGAMKVLAGAGSFLSGHPALTKDLLLGGGALAAPALLGKVAKPVMTGLQGVGKVAEVLHIPGLDKLAGIGKNTGAAALDGSAARLTAAAGSLEGAAATLKEGGLAGGVPGGGKAAGAAETAAADAEKAAGGAGAAGFFKTAGSALAAAAGPAMQGVMIGLIARGVGDQLSPHGTTAGKVNQALQQQAARAPSTLHPYSFGGLEAKAATSSGGLAIGNIINRALSAASQMATVPFHAISHPGGAPASAGAAFTGRFGPIAAPAPKITPPSAGPATAATAQIAHAMERDLGKPVKVAAPNLSALTSARGKAQAVSAAIAHAMERDLHKPVKMTAPDLSAAQAAAGKARADGANISAGLASGIEAGKGAVVAAAADVANAAAAAMAHAVQTHSPSKKTQKIGKDTAQGFVVGLEGGKSAVDAAATALGKNAAKAADITTIDSNVKKLLKDVPKGDTGLTAMLKADQGKLTALANQRSKLEAEITNAQDIAKTAISNANITGAATYQPVLSTAGGPVSSYATISGMKSMAADQKQFAATVAQLKKEGLNATSLTQITQAGPSALPMAQGLAQGGKAAIQQVNALEQQIHSSAAKLGNTAAGPMYQAGVDAAKGLAAGIKSQLGSVDAAIKQLAQHMVAAVKGALKSHSPSLVMAEVGLSIPQGVAMGIDQGTGTAMSAMARMGGRLGGTAPFHVPSGYGHPAAGGFHGGGGGGTTHVTVNVYPQGHVMTEHDLVSVVQNGLLTRGNNNWQSGVVLPGRAI